MKALSLWQPWASLVMSGRKRYETRSWATAYRGPLLIHAAKSREGLEDCYGELAEALKSEGIQFNDLPFGAILGAVELVGCVATEGPTTAQMLADRPEEEVVGNFGPNRFAWELRVIQRFTPTIPYKGSQGLFFIPGSVVSPTPSSEEGR